MTYSRRIRMSLRIGSAAGAFTALFWTVWYLVFGSVPATTVIPMTQDWSYALPFAVSRWWDIPSAAILGALVTLLVMSVASAPKERKTGLTFALTLGLTYGLAFGLTLGLTYGLAFGLALGLAFGLVPGLVFGLVFGLAYGLAFGLAYGLAFGLAYGLAFGLAYVYRNLKPWFKGIGNWLLAR